MNNVYFHRKDNKVFLLFAFSYEMSYYYNIFAHKWIVRV